MGAIEDIIDGEDFDKGCAEMLKAGNWLRNETGLSLDMFYQWADMLDSNPQLLLHQVVTYMQAQEPDKRSKV